MLIQFNTKNHKSIKNEVSLDLTSTNQKELINHIANVGYENILKFATIFGANASGKSNVINAFEFMLTYVALSFGFDNDDNDENNEKLENVLKPKPFLFDEVAQKGSSSYEVFFINQNDSKEKTIQYGFELDEKGIVNEWLFTKAKSAKEYSTVFFREKNEFEIKKKTLSKYYENLKMSLNDKTLLISLGSKLKIKEFSDIRTWFIMNELVDFGDPVESYIRQKKMPKSISHETSNRLEVVEYLNSFTEGIFKDLSIIETTDEGKEKEYRIESVHQDSKNHSEVKLPFHEESCGTQKMFALYQPLKDALDKGSVLFIDELNGRLHPLLVRSIIQIFASKDTNPNNAQLIMTSHDPWLLEGNMLRRDEIWFTEKDANEETDLYSLAEFEDKAGKKIRSDENYIKNYLVGKYGGIPQLEGLIIKGLQNE